MLMHCFEMRTSRVTLMFHDPIETRICYLLGGIGVSDCPQERIRFAIGLRKCVLYTAAERRRRTNLFRRSGLELHPQDDLAS
jgi:hypothetical protein